MVDGVTDDWPNSARRYVDETNQSELDFRKLFVTNDEDYLYLRVDLTQEVHLQEGNHVVLYLDTDNNIETGRAVHGIGADWQWDFAQKEGAFHVENEKVPATHFEMGLNMAPTVTSDSFEFSIDRRKTAVFNDEVRIVIANERRGGDSMPDKPGGVVYEFGPRRCSSRSETAVLHKQQPSDVRIVTWNVYEDGIFELRKQSVFQRLLKIIRPDIIGLQEVDNHSAEETLKAMQDILPRNPRLRFAKKFPPDLVLLSRYPFEDTFDIEGAEAGQSNGAAVVNVCPSSNKRVLLIIANPPCCDADEERQFEADAIMAFIRDAKSTGGLLDLPSKTPIIIFGDMDFVGDSRQPRTLIEGKIVNRSKYGTPFYPDWDSTEFTDLMPRHTHEPLFFTYFHPEGPYIPGRLDYFIYSDSVVKVGNRYVLSTPTMPDAVLLNYGLERDDTTTASDHLPVVADFVFECSK